MGVLLDWSVYLALSIVRAADNWFIPLKLLQSAYRSGALGRLGWATGLR